MSLGTSCSSIQKPQWTLFLPLRHGRWLTTMEGAETKPGHCAGLIKSPCPSVFLSYPNAKAVFFSRNKESNKTFYVNTPI